MAFGDLTGVTTVAGLYVALVAMVMCALFGNSKQFFIGSEATNAIITAAATAALDGSNPVRYAAIIKQTVILVGVLSVLARVARLV
jgi:MFS superfamily sulfate permease-like transporter